MSEEETNPTKINIDPILYGKLEALATELGISTEDYIKHLVSLGLSRYIVDQPELGESLPD